LGMLGVGEVGDVGEGVICWAVSIYLLFLHCMCLHVLACACMCLHVLACACV